MKKKFSKFFYSFFTFGLFISTIFPTLAFADGVTEVDFHSNNYPNLYDDWGCGQSYYDIVPMVSPTITSYRFHFNKIDTKTGDKVAVRKIGATTALNEWTGYFTDKWSDWSSGSQLKIEMTCTSDNQVGAGYYIDKIEYVGTSKPYDSTTPLDTFLKNSFPTSIISNIKYWEDPSVSTLGYATMSANARNDYDAISNANIGFTAVSTSANADLRIYAGNYGVDYFGLTKAYDTSGNEITQGASTQWYKSHVLINNSNMNSWGFNSTNKQKTVTHEYGHVLALDHQKYSDVNSVMKSGKLSYDHPQAIDIQNLQWKW